MGDETADWLPQNKPIPKYAGLLEGLEDLWIARMSFGLCSLRPFDFMLLEMFLGCLTAFELVAIAVVLILVFTTQCYTG